MFRRSLLLLTIGILLFLTLQLGQLYYYTSSYDSPQYYEDDGITNSPLFIFGHTTGHSGSGTFHNALSRPGCPWDTNSTVEAFENVADGEIHWPSDPDCHLTNTKLIPHLMTSIQSQTGDVTASRRSSTTYIDLGHFHNRGRRLECLAKHFGDRSVFIHVRRNRYNIARSFVGKGALKTPCVVDNTMYKTEKEHTRRFKFGKRRIRNRTEVSPTVGICPRSRENAGPVDLPVSDAIWDAFTPFQRFLWYADEMEHRWYSLQNMFNNDSNSDHVIVGLRGVPSFYEATWNDADELKKSVSDIRNKLSCTTEMELKNKHPHVEHRDRALNCSDQILQDHEYRKLMGYSKEQMDVLFSRHLPQHVDSEECIERRDELEQNIRKYSAMYGLEYDDRQWILPGELNPRVD